MNHPHGDDPKEVPAQGSEDDGSAIPLDDPESVSPRSGAVHVPSRKADSGRRVGSGSVLEIEATNCPRCGRSIDPDEVVCVDCGFDFRTGSARNVELGEDVSEEDDQENRRGYGERRVLIAVGGIFTLIAMGFAGYYAYPKGWMIMVGTVILALYRVLLHSALGVVALMAVMRLLGKKSGGLEVAAVRVFTAASLFLAVWYYRVPVQRVGGVLGVLLAAGAYYLAMWWLFRKDARTTAIIVGAQFLLWIFIAVGMFLAARVEFVT